MNIGQNATTLAATSPKLATFYVAGMVFLNTFKYAALSYVCLRAIVGHPIFTENKL